MFVTSPAPDIPLKPMGPDAPLDQYEVAPGQVVRLDPGEEVTVSAPADSGGTYEPFQYRNRLHRHGRANLARAATRRCGSP